MAITIESTAADLNNVQREYNQAINQIMRQGMQLEDEFTPRATDRRYVAPNVSTTDVVQPYQWQFTPTGSANFDQVALDLQPIKIDILITEGDLEKFYDSWAVEWFESGRDAMEWSFPRYLYDQVYLPKIVEEMDRNAWKGVYAAPNAGTPGLSIASVDGYEKKFKDARDAGDLTEYATGALVEGTMVNQVETWIDSLPIPYRDAQGTIYCSPTNVKKYFRNYRSNFGYGAGVDNNPNNELRVEMTNKQLKPLNALEGSDVMFFFPANTQNVIYVTRRGYPTLPSINWERHERSIKGMATIYRAYGVEFWSHLFINDQLPV
ncbi:MAG: hypothetical protein AAF828_01550 [Bacteroidota bacterium]